MTTKPCIVCGRSLSPIYDGWETMQPASGGEVRLIFSYGSEKFDLDMYGTTFKGVICDLCAEGCVARMERIERVDTPLAEMTDDERALAEELLREEES